MHTRPTDQRAPFQPWRACLPLIVLGLIATADATEPPARNDTPPPPNIILILTDDQGWTSMSSPMNENHPRARSDYHRTPHMDRLAARGMRFPEGYAASPVCSPSRYSIQFGKTPARLGKTLVRGPNRVDHSQTSIAKTIKAANTDYACAHFGKWHINAAPAALGYDISSGKTNNAQGGFTNGDRKEWSGYAADDPKRIQHLTDQGIEFMREQTAAGRPFFLQLSHYAVHSDIIYRDETLDEVMTWPEGRVHRNAKYAAMLSDLDNGIGRFMQAFDALDLAPNTYVFFLSDNGGMPVIPPRVIRGAPYESGLNAPLRRGKWDLTEGGIRVPFFVMGPGIEAGSRSDAPVVTYDLMPTFMELAGETGTPLKDLDGGSLVPILRDPSTRVVDRPLHDTIVFHFPHYNMLGLGEPHSAIRVGRYKLLRFEMSKRSLLFDLQRDLGERTDLSDHMPERVEAMERTLQTYLRSVSAETPEQSVTWKRGEEGAARTRFLKTFP